MSITKVSSPCYGIDLATYNEELAYANAVKASLEEAKAKGGVAQDAQEEPPVTTETASNATQKTEEANTSKEEAKPQKEGTLVTTASEGEATVCVTRQVVQLEPTTGEAWTEMSIKWYEQWALRGAQLAGTPLKGVIEWGMDKKIPEKSWEKVVKLDLFSYNTVGDLEKVSIQFINENEEYTHEQRVATHLKAKKLLQQYAELGWSGLVKKKLLG